MLPTKEYRFFSKVKIKNKMRGQYYPTGRWRNTNSVWPCPSCLWNEPLCLLGAEGCCKAPPCAEGGRDRHTAFHAAFHQLCFLAPSLQTVQLLCLCTLQEIFPNSNRGFAFEKVELLQRKQAQRGEQG